MENAIAIRSLSKRYPLFQLRDVSFNVPKGSIVGLIGENGAGKSTTIKCILNLIARDSGEITLLGRDNLAEERLAKEDVGVVLDESTFHSMLTARDVDKILSRVYQKWHSELFFQMCKQFDLPKNLFIKEFSRGMKMKLSIAAALAHHPKLLILDEATSGLDPVVRDDVTDLLLDFTRDEGHSILLSSHIVSDLEKVCDYIAFLHKGKLMLMEEKDALLNEYVLLQCSLREAEQIDPAAVIGRRDTPYGCRLILRRDAAPAGAALGSISIEELFIFMAKEEQV